MLVTQLPGNFSGSGAPPPFENLSLISLCMQLLEDITGDMCPQGEVNKTTLPPDLIEHPAL